MPVKARTRRSASSTFTQSHAARSDATANLSADAKLSADQRLLLLQGIAELIEQAKRLRLSECTFLLGMAQIGLQTQIHNISDEEMDAFLDVVGKSVECQ